MESNSVKVVVFNVGLGNSAVFELPGVGRLNRAYFNVPTGTDVLGKLKSVLEDLASRA